MDDLISRQAAIDALDEYFERIGKLKRRGLNKGEKAISLDTVGAIKSLPPAQPERIRGRWIAKEKKNLFRCSKCDAVIYSESEYDRNEFHKFCGRCGAEMRGELK